MSLWQHVKFGITYVKLHQFSIGACIANKTQRFRGGINISRIINDDMIPIFSESHTDSPADSSAAACN